MRELGIGWRPNVVGLVGRVIVAVMEYWETAKTSYSYHYYCYCCCCYYYYDYSCCCCSYYYYYCYYYYYYFYYYYDCHHYDYCYYSYHMVQCTLLKSRSKACFVASSSEELRFSGLKTL